MEIKSFRRFYEKKKRVNCFTRIEILGPDVLKKKITKYETKTSRPSHLKIDNKIFENLAINSDFNLCFCKEQDGINIYLVRFVINS